MHLMDADKTHGEKGRWELYKKSTRYSEQIQVTSPQETTTVRLITPYLKNKQTKTSK